MGKDEVINQKPEKQDQESELLPALWLCVTQAALFLINSRSSSFSFHFQLKFFISHLKIAVFFDLTGFIVHFQ